MASEINSDGTLTLLAAARVRPQHLCVLAPRIALPNSPDELLETEIVAVSVIPSNFLASMVSVRWMVVRFAS